MGVYLRLRVRDRTEIPWLGNDHFWCLSGDSADTQFHISNQYFVTVHLEELGSGIFASHLEQNVSTAWVGIGKLGKIINFGVDYHVKGVGGVVFCDVFASEECG